VLNQRGSATIESVFAMVFVLILALGAVQVAFALYARNVVASSAHEAARAAVERGRSEAEARGVALAVIRRAAGGVVRDATIGVTRETRGGEVVVGVGVDARLESLGPFPASIPVRVRAVASGELEVP